MIKCLCMRRFRESIVPAAVIICATIASTARATWAAVKSASTDGEATVPFIKRLDVVGNNPRMEEWLRLIEAGPEAVGEALA